MFWAAFSGMRRRFGLIPLSRDPDAARTGITQWVILKLYQQMLPTLMDGVEGAIFMQDNAPTYTAYVVRDWLAEQSFELMIWHPKSPDLNPIENLWAILKAKLYDEHKELYHMPDNEAIRDQMIIWAQEAWSSIDLSILDNLAVTMPHRVEQIIKYEGWYTSY
ncbi:uncharacterized protein N7483_002240 [Penicillium malachiteum]|uniref:uncharacterized protein n=1 Tax=Penicillium malachiteum TaxID=1324776 RepID=UPI002549B647|nr:uncharacterized protein N7483_002240 [Penicillium malachiteum]KAJ5737115.1 hypothetical protein N7483_002240 [Penicillium malachiteum]